MDDWYDSELSHDDKVVFWAVMLTFLLVICGAAWVGAQHKGDLGRDCLPDATCNHPALVCREYREVGDWRCVMRKGEEWPN